MILRKKRGKSLSGGIAVNLIATFALRAIGIITAPITTRLLETSEYGAMSIFSTWSGVATIVFGLQAYGTFANARVKLNTDEEYYHYCWNGLLLSFFGHLMGFLLMLPWTGRVSELIGLSAPLLLLLFAHSFFHNCVSMVNTYCVIENRAGLNMLISGFTSLGSFALSILFVKLSVFGKANYMAFIIGSFTMTAIVGIFGIIWFAVKGLCKVDFTYIKYCIGLSLPLIFHALSGIVLGQSDRVMMERMLNLSEAGVYSATYNFSIIPLTIWSAINSIWTPFYYRYLKSKDYNSLKQHMKNFDILYMTIYAGFLLLSPEVFHLMDSRYWYQNNIIPILLSGFFFNHLYSYPANYEFYKEKTIYIAIASFLSGVLNLLLNYLLIPRFQAIGAAVATSLSYIFLYIFHNVSARIFIKGYPFGFQYDFWRLVPIAGVNIFFFVFKEHYVPRWGLGVVIGCILLARIIKRREII